MTEHVDDFWAHDELIPFMMDVFADHEGYKWRGVRDWETSIEIAERNLHRIPFYEDFPSTIERVRLSLVNPSLLTPAEEKKYMRIATGNVQVILSIFVRHALRRGPYRLYSLGSEPSPNFPRARQDDPDRRRVTDSPRQTTTVREPSVVGDVKTSSDNYTNSGHDSDVSYTKPTGAPQDRRLRQENFGPQVGAYDAQHGPAASLHVQPADSQFGRGASPQHPRPEAKEFRPGAGMHGV